MKKINVKIQNCYGINKLECIFDFSSNNTSHIIYAPNGVMKTSFAKVFDDYSKGNKSKDLVYQEKTPIREIKDNNGNDIKQQSIFVIKPYEASYKSDKISTLLVQEELRNQYDEIYERIDIEKDKLIKDLMKVSGLRKEIEEEISQAFTGDNNKFFIALKRVEREVLDDNAPIFTHITYSVIFDEKVVDFLETGDFKEQIKKYIEKYDELLNASAFLKKGFNHYNATTVHKNLKDNGFFKAEHTINLNNRGNKTEVSNEKELLKLIEAEKQKIFSDSDLKQIFESIDKKITNKQLRDFREYLFEHKEILPELEDLIRFKQLLWISYLKECKPTYLTLLAEYKKAQEEINKIINKAEEERTDWENVIQIFNRRFYVPFKLGIINKSDAILRSEAPSIHYYFEGKEQSVEEELLLKVLSQGERRALYLLNIIFEIESRKKQNISTLFVIDDIADSFDYKNKYAIIEYLKEISECNTFASIILTHNFDFFRTVQDRVCKNRWENSYIAAKEENCITLEKLRYKYISNPFINWKRDLQNNIKLMASITFARNITEYVGDTENFNKLTSVLHMKPDTNSFTIKDIEEIYKRIFKDLDGLTLQNHDKKVIDLVYELADNIASDQGEAGLNLENKVLLSIAIRLEAEKFMIDRINDPDFVGGIKINQTGRLFGKYKKMFAGEQESIETLERVNLMTPENIHLNSFMYEPILDISDQHLKQLYYDVKSLNISIAGQQEVAVISES